MKKLRVIPALFCALPIAASAQSWLSVSGVVDVGITRGTGSIANRTQVTSGNLDSGRIAFRGEEDLGSGHRAFFWLETQVANDNGAGNATNTNNQSSGGSPPQAGGQGLTFHRVSLVGLIGPWGQVRAGRTYTPTFLAHAIHDPGGATGMMAGQAFTGALSLGNPSGVRASNSFGYYNKRPEEGGLFFQVMYALGENASDSGATKDDGRYLGFRVTHTEGPVMATLASAVYKVAATGDLRETVVGARLDVSVVKLWALWVRNSTGSANSMKGVTLAVTHQAGPTLWKASVSASALRNFAGNEIGSTRKIALGAVYNFSQRTAAYATLARTANSHGASGLPNFGSATTGANRPATGQEIGIRQLF